nr:tetraspanin [Hymenolepis microstoma]
MGCAISCGIKLVLQIVNTILFLAFLAVAIFGILLKTSKSVVESILNRILKDQFNEEQKAQMAQFIIKNADAVSIVLIVVGLVLAALCLIGCIASCCGCNILLKIYAGILILLVVLQIAAVIYLLADHSNIAKFVIKSMKSSLAFYGMSDEKGKLSTAIWELTMNFNKTAPCCGMQGYGDFAKGTKLPIACCNNSAGSCTETEAEKAKVAGCESNIVKFTHKHLKTIVYVWILAIILQLVPIVLVLLAICL